MVVVVTDDPPPRALAAAAVVSLLVDDHLLKLRRPDHLPRQARAAIDARDRRAFGRGHHLEIGQPRPFDRALALRAEQRLVDGSAGERAGQAPGNRAGRAEHGAAGGRARHG